MTSAASATCARARCCRIARSTNCASSTRSTWAPSATPTWRRASSRRAFCCGLRFELDQYINLRPVKLYPGVETPAEGQRARGHRLRRRAREHRRTYTRHGRLPVQGHAPGGRRSQMHRPRASGVERCLRYAFELTRKSQQRRQASCTLCGKTNVLTYVHDLWERAFHEMGEGVPGHQARLRPRRRHLHVVRQEPGVVRRDRDRATCSATSSPTSAR